MWVRRSLRVRTEITKRIEIFYPSVRGQQSVHTNEVEDVCDASKYTNAEGKSIVDAVEAGNNENNF